MAVRKDKKRGWVVDFIFRHPDGQRERVRSTSVVQTKRGAEEYERQLRVERLNPSKPKVEAPKLGDFAETFQKSCKKSPSESESKKTILDLHIIPLLGSSTRLDAISTEKIAKFKVQLEEKKLSPKRINNILTVLRKMLSLAAEWGKIDAVPRIRWAKVPDHSTKFDYLQFDEAERLLDSADSKHHCMLLLALRTGLRGGEIRALTWDKVDLKKATITVSSAEWKGTFGPPKSGKDRVLPIADDLLAALSSHRHLRGPYVFCQDDGKHLTKGMMKWPLWSACTAAGLRKIGWHVLRHTFASHLAMRGSPMVAIMKLMGHSTLKMTLRYSHLAPDFTANEVNRLCGTYTTQMVDSGSKVR